MEQAFIKANPDVWLMERAATAVFNYISKHYDHHTDIAVLAGKGNNGGDGILVAALLKKAQYQVRIIHMAPLDQYRGDAKKALDMALQYRVECMPFSAEYMADDQADLWLDALLGIGFKAPLREPYREAITALNQKEASVIALDVPSGLAPDTGVVEDVAVSAVLSISFIADKFGFHTADGPDHVGQLFIEDLGVLQQDIRPCAHILNQQALKQALPAKKQNSHKHQFGHVLAIGGTAGMLGALVLAAQGAFAAGAGLVTMASCKGHAEALAIHFPRAMSRAIESLDDCDLLFKEATVVVIGPGMDHSPWSKMVFEAAIACDLPMVIDAGALGLLAKRQAHKAIAQSVITPHPGEAASLLGTSSKEVQQDRLAALKGLSKWGGICDFKGAGQFVACSQSYSKIMSLWW